MNITARTSVAVALGKYVAPKQSQTAVTHEIVELKNPVQHLLGEYIQRNRRMFDVPDVVWEGVADGRSLAICGAGPSLRGATRERFAATQDLWAVNSALPYLTSQGVPVTAAFGIDQTPGLLREWSDPPDVTYLVASSVDPELVHHLKDHNRKVVFFHSMVGVENSLEDEVALYKKWPSTRLVTTGFSASSRALALAEWMGYERVDMHGVDCCFGFGDIAHANGEHANDAYNRPAVSKGTTNGREFRTRPDMLMDAVFLVRRVRETQGRIRLIGDTLPVQLLGKPNEYLDLVCRRPAPDENLAVENARLFAALDKT